jgi:hypothetical protein
MGATYPSRATPRADLGMALELHAAGENFISDVVMPPLEVQEEKGYYSAIPAAVLLQNPSVLRAADGSYPELSVSAEDKSFACVEYGIEGRVDDTKRLRYANDFSLEVLVSNACRRSLLLAREIRVQALLFNETTFSGYVTDYSSSAPWSTSSSDAVAQVRAAVDSITLRSGRPNAIIMGLQTLTELLALSVIKDAFHTGTVTQAMLEASVASILGVDQLIVGREPYNTADQGQALTASSIWGSTYVLVARLAPSGSGNLVPCLGRSPFWGAISPMPYSVESYRKEEVKADMVRAYNCVDEIVHDAAFGQLLKV